MGNYILIHTPYLTVVPKFFKSLVIIHLTTFHFNGQLSGGPRGGTGAMALPGPDHQPKIVLKMTVLDT